MAHLLEAKGDALVKGITGDWNKITITPREPNLDSALADILVSFDGLSKPKIEFKYETEKLIVMYKPLVPGEYKLEISKNGIDINGSPFTVHVEGLRRKSIIAMEKARPDLMKITGDLTGKKDQLNEIIVDGVEACVFGKLKASMEGPTFPMLKYGKPDIKVIDFKKGIKKIQYNPKFASKYKLYLEFEECKVPGSPFEVIVE